MRTKVLSYRLVNPDDTTKAEAYINPNPIPGEFGTGLRGDKPYKFDGKKWKRLPKVSMKQRIIDLLVENEKLNEELRWIKSK